MTNETKKRELEKPDAYPALETVVSDGVIAVLPVHTTPDELADHLGASRRTTRAKVREFDLYIIIGQRMLMLPHHVAGFMRRLDKCHSGYTGAEDTTGIAAALPDGNYTDLQKLRTKPARKGSQRKPKPPSGKVISMGQGRR